MCNIGDDSGGEGEANHPSERAIAVSAVGKKQSKKLVWWNKQICTIGDDSGEGEAIHPSERAIAVSAVGKKAIQKVSMVKQTNVYHWRW